MCLRLRNVEAKRKTKFVLSPILLFENSRPLSPPRDPQTPLPSGRHPGTSYQPTWELTLSDQYISPSEICKILIDYEFMKTLIYACHVKPSVFFWFSVTLLYFSGLWWVSIAVCGLISSCGTRGLVSAYLVRLLTVAASLLLGSAGPRAHVVQWWQPPGSVVEAHGFRCSTARGIFLDQVEDRRCRCLVALWGRFLTPGPEAKPSITVLN